LRLLGGASGGLGGYFGASLSSEYGWWPGLGYALAVSLGIGVLGLLWQFAFFVLSPMKVESKVAALPWGADAPKMKLSPAPTPAATQESPMPIKPLERADDAAGR